MANRNLARAGVLATGRTPAGGGETDADAESDDKFSPLSPAGLVEDPATFYAALEERLAEAPLVNGDDPTPVSPATRLIDACRNLG